MLPVQYALVTVLLFPCFCSAYKVTGPEIPIEQDNPLSDNTEISGKLDYASIVSNLTDSRINLTQSVQQWCQKSVIYWLKFIKIIKIHIYLRA